MKRVVITFICFCYTFTLPAQDSLYIKPGKAWLQSFITSGKGLITYPVHTQRNDRFFMAGATVLTLFTFTQDEKIRKAFEPLNGNRTTFVNYSLEPWGAAWPMLIVCGLQYGSGTINYHGYDRYMALLETKTLLYTGLLSRIPKYIFQRHRPDDDDIPDYQKWEGPLHGLTGFESFPSGHTYAAFAFAAVTSSGYSDKRWVSIVLYSLASLTAISRIYQHEHWGSDVVAGAALGYATGKLIWRFDHPSSRRKEKTID